jgi:lipid-A-disaccharide synthase
MAPPKIFLSAGEASGENYGTLLIDSIRRLEPQTEFFGMGGQRMEARGLRRIVRAEDVAVMGITEVIRHMPRIYGEYRKLKASVRAEQPGLAILIDFPDVHLRLARDLRRLGIPVIFFVSPQLWAWKKHRIRQVQRFVDRMLVIFPFEEPFYRQRGVDAFFVGHPLADLPLPSISRNAFAREHNLDASKQWIGLLPGSREKEIRLNLPEMLKAAADLVEEAEFLLPLAPTLTPQQVNHVQAMLADFHFTGTGRRVSTVTDARAVLHHARASVVASGTATVEAALIGNPFVVVYRVSQLTYEIARRVVKVPHVAMVNLVAGREVVPELIQDEFTATNVVRRLAPLLHDQAAREAMQADLRRVGSLLKTPDENAQTAIDQVARISMQLFSEFQHRQLHPGQVANPDSGATTPASSKPVANTILQSPVPPRKAQ